MLLSNSTAECVGINPKIRTARKSEYFMAVPPLINDSFPLIKALANKINIGWVLYNIDRNAKSRHFFLILYKKIPIFFH